MVDVSWDATGFVACGLLTVSESWPPGPLHFDSGVKIHC